MSSGTPSPKVRVVSHASRHAHLPVRPVPRTPVTWIIARLGALLLLLARPVAGQPAAFVSPLTLTSGDARLVDAFTWARTQASAYASTADPVGPWFEAALPGRDAFCMRDVAHQAIGAHALGMQRQVHNMLHRFAENISEQRDWASFWEITRANQPAPVDYRSDSDFWYNLPANFDVLDAAWRMYTWSGDPSYLRDSTFMAFYRHSVTDYVDRWALGTNAVMTRERIMNRARTADPAARFAASRGIPGYNEESDDFTVGLDLLAAEYAGFAAYARVLEARGDMSAARAWLQRAGEVKTLVNTEWWDEKAQSFHDFVSDTKTLTHRRPDTWNSAALYWPVATDGPHARATVRALVRQIARSRSAPIEEQSHHPEVLYRYGASDVAYDQIMDLTRADRARREYPEVSFAVVGAMVTGVFGVSVDPVTPGREHALLPIAGLPQVFTLSQLTRATQWAELAHLPVRDNDITLRHDGQTVSVLTNNRGPALIWRAAFPGRITSLLVNGTPRKAAHQQLTLGRVVSVVRVVVAPGHHVRVAVSR